MKVGFIGETRNISSVCTCMAAEQADSSHIITEEEIEERRYIQAEKDGATKVWEVKAFELNRYDSFSVSLQKGRAQEADYRDALKDMEIWERGERGRRQ